MTHKLSHRHFITDNHDEPQDLRVNIIVNFVTTLNLRKWIASGKRYCCSHISSLSPDLGDYSNISRDGNNIIYAISMVSPGFH